MASEMTAGGRVVLIRGAGEMATGVAYRLLQARFRVCLLEIPRPMAVRRTVSFCEAVYCGEMDVEGVVARRIGGPREIEAVWREGKIPVLIDPEAKGTREFLKPDVVVDAILAKQNLGTAKTDAPLVVGLGPGFTAGADVHAVVETNRGHHLGRVLWRGAAEPDTGVPGEVGGSTEGRVLRAPRDGVFHVRKTIGESVSEGTPVALVDDSPVIAAIPGMIRGMLHDGLRVERGVKVGDIDPRGRKEYCFTISEKARSIGGGVLEAILHRFGG
jgi:xanthine dehydrogenase accessory factor